MSHWNEWSFFVYMILLQDFVPEWNSHSIIGWTRTGMTLSSMTFSGGSGRVFNKNQSMWQKFRSRQRRDHSRQRCDLQGGGPGAWFPRKIKNLDLLKCVSCILEQEVGCFNRTIHCLFIQLEYMNALKNFWCIWFLLIAINHGLSLTVSIHLKTVSPVSNNDLFWLFMWIISGTITVSCTALLPRNFTMYQNINIVDNYTYVNLQWIEPGRYCKFNVCWTRDQTDKEIKYNFVSFWGLADWKTQEHLSLIVVSFAAVEKHPTEFAASSLQ